MGKTEYFLREEDICLSMKRREGKEKMKKKKKEKKRGKRMRG